MIVGVIVFVKEKKKFMFLSLRLRDIWDITTKRNALSLDFSVRDGNWYYSEPMTEKQDNKSGDVLKFFVSPPNPQTEL